MLFPPPDGPWGAVYPAPRHPIHPLSTGQEFMPSPTAAGADWASLRALAARHDWQLPLRWRRELHRPGLALILTDAAQQICWVNAGFTRMSGYPAAAVLGRQPGLLQGAATDAATRATIRQCLQRGQPFRGTLLNYRRTGEPYQCHVRIHPVRNTAGVLTHFLAFEHEIIS